MTLRSFNLCLILLCCISNSIWANDDYLRQATTKYEVAWDLKDPVMIREYTVLVTEFYSHQFLFRAFALPNLKPGENLWAMRIKQDEVTMTESQGLLENNLEELLVKAQKAFSNDLNIQFAIAQFLYLGRDLLPSPALKMSRESILETFTKAEKAGIASSTSLFVLAITTLAEQDSDKEALSYLERAHAENRHNPEILAALSSQAISMGDFTKGGQFARLLFERAPTPNYRAEALLQTARVFTHRGDCKQALIAARASLDLQPKLALAWTLGLDCLRQEKEPSSYVAFVQRFLDQDENDPSLFRIYLDYLKLRGTHSHDKSFFEAYCNLKFETPIARMTQVTNIGNYHFQSKAWHEAHSAYQMALDLYKKLENAPPFIEQMLNELVDLAQKEMQSKSLSP